MKKEISSKKQIIFSIMIFTIPLLLLLLAYNIYTMNILNLKLAETGSNIINVYQSPLEKELRNTEEILVDIVANDTDFQQLIYSSKQVDIYVYTQNIMQKIKRLFRTLTGLAGCYVYNETENIIQETYQGNYTYNQKQIIKQFFKEYIQEDEYFLNNRWIFKEIEEQPFLFRIFKKNNSYLMGIFDLNKVDKPQYYPSNNKDAFLLFTDMEQNPITEKELVKEKGIALKDVNKKEYYITGSPQKFLVVQNKSSILNLNLVYAVPYYGCLMSFDKMPFFFLALSIFVIILMFFAFRLLEKNYWKPLDNLIITMEAVKGGNIEAKMICDNHISEFSILSNTFNEMLEEIKVLKISAYESQLETQQAKLQYLQIQIRPHFFLNCLKNLYSLAQEEKYGQIQETILALSNHLRFILKDNFSMISMETELQSVRNYILLQQLSTSYKVSCNIEIREELQKFQIPPLSILTFVENSIKHAQTISKHLQIKVKVTLLNGDKEKFVNIAILDNGSGFSEHSLQHLNGTTDIVEEEIHIGIQNVKHRFSLIYNGESTFLFSNTTTGASIEIFIPITCGEEERNGG